MALSGILADFRTHIVYTVYITIHKIRFNIYISCIIYKYVYIYDFRSKSEWYDNSLRSGIRTSRSTKSLHHSIRRKATQEGHTDPVSTCFQMFPVLRQDFHHLCASQDFMGICRFRQGWSGERELKPRNRHIGPTATRIFQFIQEEAPWNFPEQVAVSQIRRKGFFPFVALRKDNQKYCGR
jgi:hypothetical protein